MKINSILVLLILFIPLCSFCFAENIKRQDVPVNKNTKVSPEIEIANMIQNRYMSVKDIFSEFTQVTHQPHSKEPIKASGVVYFKRNEKMRWEYKKPEKQVIVTVGENVYLYEEEAKQILVYPKIKFFSSEILRIFFIGKGEILQNFNIYPLEDDGDVFPKERSIKLIPKRQNDETGIKYIYLSVDERENFVKGVRIVDKLDVRTDIFFTNISINTGLSDEIFDFIPPKDVTFYYYQ